ncbi:MAG: RagB/SusD family nutrient uptake outer membrane protein [Prevotella sp.]|nr:RagB/SusD family nutrient uptake outer membrane protein [Prevotella sp.]
MKENKIITILLIVTMALFQMSCSDYLDKNPSKSSNAPISNADQLFALLDYVSNTYETNMAAVYTTDDCGLSMGLLDAFRTAVNYADYYTFHHEGLAALATDALWSGEYKKIYTANTIIASAGDVDNQTLAKEALANAYFTRAWSYFTLTQYYCLPYCDANKQTTGLPLRKSTDFEEDVSRATLEETFAFILDDLKKAEEVSLNSPDPDRRWRASKCAVNAFYARLNLVMGNYQEALTYANNALGSAPALFDYNSFAQGNTASYAATAVLPAQTLYYCETNQWSESKFLYFPEYIFTRFAYCRYQWMIPSAELVSIYDQENDMRFKWFMIPHSNRRFNCAYDEYRYDQFYDGRYAFTGLSTAELMLIKAECEVRTGNWQQGIRDLDALRAKRYLTGAESALTATSQQDALKKVLEERRREMPFTQRMTDIKRFAVNETSEDDVTITRDFYEMTLSGANTSVVKHFSVGGNDVNLLLPITDIEINASQGRIQQNPY